MERLQILDTQAGSVSQTHTHTHTRTHAQTLVAAPALTHAQKIGDDLHTRTHAHTGGGKEKGFGLPDSVCLQLNKDSAEQ